MTSKDGEGKTLEQEIAVFLDPFKKVEPKQNILDKKNRPRRFSFPWKVPTFLATVLLGGFLAYSNVHSIKETVSDALEVVNIMFSDEEIPSYTFNKDYHLLKGLYYAKESIVVGPSATLTIDPGVTIRFRGCTKLVVNGTLLAKGLEGDSITFTSANDFYLSKTGWSGLLFKNTASKNTIHSSSLNYCKIEEVGGNRLYNNMHGVDINNPNTFVSIDNSLIQNNAGLSGVGIELIEGTLYISNSIIKNNYAAIYAGGLLSSKANLFADNIKIINNVGLNISSGPFATGMNLTSTKGYLKNSTIVRNTGNNVVGGIRISGNGSSKNDFVLENNIIKDNSGENIVIK